MTHSKILFIAALTLMPACKGGSRPPKPPEVSAVFPTLPLPPDAEFISKEGGEDALQLTLFSPAPTPVVTGYYRSELSRKPWRLTNDTKTSDGAVVLYAEQNGRPLWVRIWSTSDQAGTMVQLAGSVQSKDSVTAQSGLNTPKKRGK